MFMQEKIYGSAKVSIPLIPLSLGSFLLPSPLVRVMEHYYLMPATASQSVLAEHTQNISSAVSTYCPVLQAQGGPLYCRISHRAKTRISCIAPIAIVLAFQRVETLRYQTKKDTH